ncbi:MAG TPA: hypothetical protein PLK35_01155 [Candidatus Moranbacteria bacterium]|nr:hypothetical protein [Candidatus Moranbacteria bacterium]
MIKKERPMKDDVHRFNGDLCFCPKTGKWKLNGIHTNGKCCDQCGASLLDEDATKKVSNHCHAG